MAIREKGRDALTAIRSVIPYWHQMVADPFLRTVTGTILGCALPLSALLIHPLKVDFWLVGFLVITGMMINRRRRLPQLGYKMKIEAEASGTLREPVLQKR